MKKMLFGLVALAAASLFAACNDTVILFGSEGPDRYADGTTVLDGEQYAIVFTAAGEEFGGFNADGTLVSAGDTVVFRRALAKDGRCQSGAIQLSAETVAKLGEGSFGLYLLDTRVFATAADGVSPAVTVGGAATAASSVGKSDVNAGYTLGGSVKTDAIEPGSGVAAVPAGSLEKPVITGIEVDDEYVVLHVGNTSGLSRYDVVAGGLNGESRREGVANSPKTGAKGDVLLVVPRQKDKSGEIYSVKAL